MKLPLPPPRRSSRQDEMLPLINIVFLLLIFFMLAGAIRSPELLPVQPPRSATDRAAEEVPSMLVVGADGRLALGREVFTREGLAERIADWLAAVPAQTPLTVKADAELEALAVLELLETLRALGVPRAVLVTARLPATP